MENKEAIARDIYRKVKEKQLKEFQERMPENKQGVEFEANGVKYVAAIRRLTPQECAELQTMPHDYEFVTSETQQYKGLGNGWNIETIKHIFSFIPKIKLNNLKVLSLFDGISGGQVSLRGIGANITTYLASEIDKHAIANTMHNFPNTIQLGSVTELNVDEIVEFVKSQQKAIEDINAELKEVAEIVENNAASAQENTAISQQLGDCARSLKQTTDSFILK